jgi:hypothetical protein
MFIMGFDADEEQLEQASFDIQSNDLQLKIYY